MAHDPTLPFQRRLLPPGVGTALRDAREARGWTRREVASAVGISPRTLARIERGHQKPLWPTLERLSDHLGISVATLARRWLRDSFDVPTRPSSAPGIALRALRLERGMTLVDLEAASGISAATISRFERGLTASRLIGPQLGVPAMAESYVAPDEARLAAAFGFGDAGGLWRACLAAFDARGGAE